MELSDNDKQRIEQFIKDQDHGQFFAMRLTRIEQEAMRIAAEYATLYERQQQSELLQENERQSEQIKKLEELLKECLTWLPLSEQREHEFYNKIKAALNL